MRVRTFGVLILLFATAILVEGTPEEVRPVPQQLDKQRISLTACSISDVAGEALCGTLDVFENRKAGKGRRIALKIVVLSAIHPQPVPEALFILAGGPGQAATENAEFFATTFANVRQKRDIVLVDQRGTGSSNPLDCDLRAGSGLQRYFGDLYPLDAVRRCREELQQKADLRLYTTPIAMDDLDEIRSALGYERINLFGTSYGTRAALVYMRRYPNRVRSVILKGVVPMSLILPHTLARDAQRSIDLIFEECAMDEECRKAFPNLKQNFETVLSRLRQRPARLKWTNPDTRETESIEISHGLFATTLRSLLQNVNAISQVPMLIQAAFNNDFAPWARLAFTFRRGAADLLSAGMFLSVVCAEDIPQTSTNGVAREGKGTFLGDYYANQILRASEVWQCGDRPRGYNNPVRSKVPALLISGHFDPATPPDNGSETARYLLNSLHLVIKNASHSYARLSPCVDNIMAAFIDKGSTTGLDTSCTDRISRLPFVIKSTSAASPAKQ